MKVNANPMAAFQRETAPGKAMNKPNKAASTPQSETRPSAVTPPGLQKVISKLEALGDSRTQGQNVAMNRIGRNLARYAETQAMVPPQAPVVDETPDTTEDVAAAEEALPLSPDDGEKSAPESTG